MERRPSTYRCHKYRPETVPSAPVDSHCPVLLITGVPGGRPHSSKSLLMRFFCARGVGPLEIICVCNEVLCQTTPHGRIRKREKRYSVMGDYETGRKARREGQPVQANPYWGWFRRCAWERGWVDEEKALRSVRNPRGSEYRIRCLRRLA